jgi:hypothetical protein
MFLTGHLAPEKRASLGPELPLRGRGDAASRSFHVESSTVDAMEAAVVEEGWW